MAQPDNMSSERTAGCVGAKRGIGKALARTAATTTAIRRANTSIEIKHIRVSGDHQSRRRSFRGRKRKNAKENIRVEQIESNTDAGTKRINQRPVGIGVHGYVRVQSFTFLLATRKGVE